jgi:tRNA 2-thiouridine synthesizing protein A
MQQPSNKVLDARGLTCPEPLMLVRNAVRAMVEGEALTILATDPSTVRDFANFCRFMGHELVQQSLEGSEYTFVLRKGNRTHQ